MIEKGRKTYQIFQLYGIDTPSKKLAIAIHTIEGKIAQRGSSRLSGTLDVQQQQVYNVCKKINKPLRTTQEWLQTISISPEIQKAEVKKPKEEKVAGATLARLSTVEDEKLQKKLYSKIGEQEMGQETASRFITKVKKLPERSQEAILSPGIRPEVEGIETEPIKVEIPEADARTLREAIEEERIEREEKLKQPEVKERSRKMNSWLAHSNIDVGHLTCPVCGADHGNLKWACHDMTIEEAIKYLHDKLEEKKEIA